MTDGFDEAKRERNWLERLGEKIPGFRGFQDRELRRDVDKMQRDHLAMQLARVKTAVRRRAQAWTDAGRIGDLHLFDRLDRRLDGLAMAVRFCDYGATGLFDAVKVDESDLERLYEFDLSLLADIAAMEAVIEALGLPQDGQAKEAIDEALTQLGVVEEKWAGRERVISDVIKSTG